MEKLIKEKSFKEMIESIGCKFILADMENGFIAVYCKAKSQNDIIFKIILNDSECVELINSYGIYKKDKITKAYQYYLSQQNKSLEF